MSIVVTELKIFQVGYGDCFSLAFGSEFEQNNIFIDSGYAKTYHTTISKEIAEKKSVDLWIFTHTDKDHLGGTRSIMKEFNEKKPPKFLKKIWFNFFEKSITTVKACTGPEEYKSYKDGIDFRDYIKHYELDHVTKVVSGHTTAIGRCKITVLAPSSESYENYRSKWLREEGLTQKKLRDKEKSKKKTDHAIPVSGFADSKFLKDDSIENASSIAFIFEIGALKILFLGDSHADDVMKGLNAMGWTKQNPLRVDYIKISHHGSKYNTSDELLDILDCSRYIISTDGSDCSPDKLTLSKIVLRRHESRTTFYFNYRNKTIESIFNAVDLREYNIELIYPNDKDNHLLIEHTQIINDIHTS